MCDETVVSLVHLYMMSSSGWDKIALHLCAMPDWQGLSGFSMSSLPVGLLLNWCMVLTSHELHLERSAVDKS